MDDPQQFFTLFNMFTSSLDKLSKRPSTGVTREIYVNNLHILRVDCCARGPKSFLESITFITQYYTISNVQKIFFSKHYRKNILFSTYKPHWLRNTPRRISSSSFLLGPTAGTPVSRLRNNKHRSSILASRYFTVL